MDMNISDALRCACGYLSKLEGVEGDHRVNVPPALREQLESAAQEAEDELRGEMSVMCFSVVLLKCNRHSPIDQGAGVSNFGTI